MCGACLVVGLSLSIPFFTCAPCSVQNCAYFLTSPCTCVIAGFRLQAPRLSAAVLWAQLGEELQHLHQADPEAEYQHMLLNVHRKLCELEALGIREKIQQQLQQWFTECWLVSARVALLLSFSMPIPLCCFGTLHCPPNLCKIEILCCSTRLLVPLCPCPVGLGGMSSIFFSPCPLPPDHVQPLLAWVSVVVLLGATL